MNKYRNTPVVVDGIRFSSTAEAGRYRVLALKEKAGEIVDLRCQVDFELIPNQKKKNGKLERKCVYVGDFSYRDKFGSIVVEDVKSVASKTPQYIIKRKLMLKIYGIEIKEVL